MAAALVATPDECVVGQPIVITGTGFTATTAFTVEIENPEENMDITVTGATDGGGALTTDGLVKIVPQTDGEFTFRVVCASDDLSVTVTVAES